MLKKLYSKVMSSTDRASTEGSMYYDSKLAMVRSVNKSKEPVSYCASPVFLSESFLSGKNIDKKAVNAEMAPA